MPLRLTQMTFAEFLTWYRGARSAFGARAARRMVEYARRRSGLSPSATTLHTCDSCDTSIVLVDRSANGVYDGFGCHTCQSCSDHCDCYVCQGCERRYSPDSMSYCEHDVCNDCSCDTCAEENERANGDCKVEHINNELTFHNAAKTQFKVNKSRRHVAVEIEVANVEEAGRIAQEVDSWSGCIVEDGSLPETGFEINTAPANGDEFVDQIKDITSALNKAGAEVTSDCGLHVHVDARDFSYYDVQKLCVVYHQIENWLFAMVPPRRKESTYCKPCGAKLLPDTHRVSHKQAKRALFSKLYMKSTLGRGSYNERKDKYNQARYDALNLHSWLFRGTIECRMFNGTVDRTKITMWGMLWANILDFAKRYTDVEIEKMAHSMNGYDLLTLIADNTEIVNFINERIVKHGSQSQKDYVGSRSTFGISEQLLDVRTLNPDLTNRIFNTERV